MSPSRNRRLAIVAAVAFFVSSVFPVVGGLSHNTASFPKWWGTLDVSLAFVLALLALAILGVTQGKVNKQAEDMSYRAYRILTHGIFLMLVLFFLVGDRITWINCLTGLAVEDLVALVYLARMGYGCYAAEGNRHFTSQFSMSYMAWLQ